MQIPFNPPLVTNNGTLLLSCYLPLAAKFFDVVGRNPDDGESVTLLNALTQLETTTTFHNGSWDNGDPLLAVGQSAFFNLGPQAAVPEPASVGFGLFGAGLLALAKGRKVARTN